MTRVTMPIRPTSTLWQIRIAGLVVGAAHLWLSLSLILQPARWVHVPAFEYIFRIWRPQVWGAIDLAAVLLVCVGLLLHRHLPARLGISTIFGITLAWFVTFVLDWFVVPNALPYAGATSLMQLWLLFRLGELI